MGSRNKITHEWTEDGSALVFTGTIRQPTLVEVHNYMQEMHSPIEGVFAVCARLGDEWWPPEVNRSVVLYPFEEHCPVCGHVYNFDSEDCPLCHRRWD